MVPIHSGRRRVLTWFCVNAPLEPSIFGAKIGMITFRYFTWS